jgi:hypothetical protein
MVAWGMFGDPWKIPSVRDLGVRTTGSFWCLTAGAEEACKDPALREAVVRDIEGAPIVVPWLAENRSADCRNWWGCVNTKAFPDLCIKRLGIECAQKPDGIHIDDPIGGTYESLAEGGCFCDACMARFSEWLLVHASAGASSFQDFDYRTLIRSRAKTRTEYVRLRKTLPLRAEYEEFQLDAARQNFSNLAFKVRERLGPDAFLSANLYFADYGDANLVLTPYLTHIVCEVFHYFGHGTGSFRQILKSYRQADALGLPLAATASGEDWSRVRDKGAVNLVKVWIALAYASGQFFLVPDPEHQWCHDAVRGTSWYKAPRAEFAPIYRFIREHRNLFDGFETAGPLAPPRLAANPCRTKEQRAELKASLESGDPRPMTASDPSVWVLPRKNGNRLSVHLLNTDYDRVTDRIIPKKALTVSIPAALAPASALTATLYSHDRKRPVRLSFDRNGESVAIRVPALSLWAIVSVE